MGGGLRCVCVWMWMGVGGVSPRHGCLETMSSTLPRYRDLLLGEGFIRVSRFIRVPHDAARACYYLVKVFLGVLGMTGPYL